MIIAVIALAAGLMLSGCGETTGWRSVYRYKGNQKYEYDCGNPKHYPLQGDYIRDVAAIDRDGIHYAAWRGDLAKVESLLAQNPEAINATVRNHPSFGTTLHWAAYSGHKDVVELLIRKGANVNAVRYDIETPLYTAAIRGHKAIVKLLIANRAQVTGLLVHPSWRTEQHSILYYTLFWGQKNREEIVKLLIANGADINASVLGEDWQEPYLHAAIACHRQDVAKLLINSGADLSARNNWERTPLHLAVEEGIIGTARLLIANKADVNAKGVNGQSPLHSAAAAGRKTLAKLLILKGADVNAKNNQGETPLHVADAAYYLKQSQRRSVTKLLRKHGGRSGKE